MWMVTRCAVTRGTRLLLGKHQVRLGFSVIPVHHEAEAANMAFKKLAYAFVYCFCLHFGILIVKLVVPFLVQKTQTVALSCTS